MQREDLYKRPSETSFPSAEELRGDPACHTPAFLRELMERCNYCRSFEPARSLDVALVGRELVRLYASEDADLAAYAGAVVGSCYRALGRLAKAEECFAEVVRELESLAPITRARILEQLALLRRHQKRFEAALETIDRAISIYRMEGPEPDLHRFGVALTARCTIHSCAGDDDAAMSDVGLALKHIDVHRSPENYAAAIHNLAALLQRSTRPDGVMRAAEHTRQAFRVGRFGRRSVPRAKLYWVQGQIDRRLGVSRRAERMFRRARELMVAHQLPLEVAVVSLDLASLLLEEGRYAEIPAIAGEAVELFRDQVADPEALQALRVWKRAADASALSEAINSQVRAKLWAATCAPTTDTTARLPVPLAGAR